MPGSRSRCSRAHQPLPLTSQVNGKFRAWEVTARIAGKGSAHGIGSNVLGDPWEALLWLVNECSEHGMLLAEGQLVSTGTCLVPVAVSEGDVLTTDYGVGDPLKLVFS